MLLYLASQERKITNEHGKEVSLDNAKRFWLNGEVQDCSLSFERLAGLDFDFDELDRFYNSCK